MVKKCRHLAALLTLCFAAGGQALAQTPEFSNAHKKVARHFESLPQDRATRALWIRHNALVLAVEKGIKPKEYAKQACQRLHNYGFGGQGITVYITNAQELRANRVDHALAERECDD